MANERYENLSPNGHSTMVTRIFSKLKGWVEGKVQTDVPANAVFTDGKVTQTHSYSSTYDNNYSILMGESTKDYQDHTEGSRKTPNIFGNPYTGTIGATNLIIYEKTREGRQTTASGDYSHVEGDSSVASGTDAHAEGYHTTASGNHSHAEGMTNTAGSLATHAEGVLNTVNGAYSHIEGGHNTITADGLYAHVEGQSNNASAGYTHVEGYGNIASKPYQHVGGKYNVEDPSSTSSSTYVEIIGNGTATDARSNARTLDWNGNEWVAGNYYDVNGKLAHKPLTEDQYMALSQAEQLDGTEYFVRDRVPLQICDYIYPIGAIYMSVTNVSPAILFGGTWERIEDKFLLAAGQTYNVGSSGGEAEHILTTDEIPAHTHGNKSLTGTMNPLAWAGSASESGIVSGRQNHTDRVGNSGSNWGDRIYTINASHEHNSVGLGYAHNNMPPYLVVNVWMRVPDPVEEEEE